MKGTIMHKTPLNNRERKKQECNNKVYRDIIRNIRGASLEEECEIMNKINFVDMHHKYAISHHHPTESNPKDYYITRLPNGKKMKGDTKEKLLDKLYNYYMYNKDLDHTFGHIFDVALDEHAKMTGVREKTIERMKNDYNAFITNEWAQRDITVIQPSEVKGYILEQLKMYETTYHTKMTNKRFYAFKAVLNLVFRYAVDPEHHILTVNPMPISNDAFKRFYICKRSKPEEKAYQPADIEKIQNHIYERMKRRNPIYQVDMNGYAILLSIETGMRCAELCSLKWEDIKENTIHIHSQLLDQRVNGARIYYYEPTTKDEKGCERGGREFPKTRKISEILDAAKLLQQRFLVKSDYVFARRDGSWMTTEAYSQSLYKLAKELGLELTNNHAFRIALNSYKLMNLDLNATERGRLLGHSAEVNAKHYTFARADDFLPDICNRLDAFDSNQSTEEVGTQGNPKTIDFEQKKKALESAKIQAF